MNVAELKALAQAAEALSGAAAGLHGHAEVAAYNNLVSRFRERVTRALNRLTLGQAVEPELTNELWLMAREMPAARRSAEAVVQREPTLAE